MRELIPAAREWLLDSEVSDLHHLEAGFKLSTLIISVCFSRKFRIRVIENGYDFSVLFNVFRMAVASKKEDLQW